MEKLKGYNFELQKGDLILFKHLQINRIGDFKSYVGEIRDYDGINSKSGVLSKGYISYCHSMNISEIDSPLVFCWYKGSMRILRDFDGIKYNIEEPNELKKVELFKLSEVEKEKFKSLVIKTKIANSL